MPVAEAIFIEAFTIFQPDAIPGLGDASEWRRQRIV
jgi:hypothetical protein